MFGIGPWALSDRMPVNGSPTLGQQYWEAPASGLSARAGALTFESAVTGSGSFNIGIRGSTLTPNNEGSLDVAYIDSETLCTIAVGQKSCFFPLTIFAIPPRGFFALNVLKTGSPVNTGQFNWQMTCTAATPSPTPTPTPTPTPSPSPTPTPGPPRLLLEESGPVANLAAALDSVLFVRDPFPVINSADLLNLGGDRNTRVNVFVSNLHLLPGETASDITIHLVDSNNQSIDLTAEAVRLVPNEDFTQVVFRLPDNISIGACTVTVTFHAQVTNPGLIRIRN